MVTRTRFAPSPSGDLHIGGARTALFNWLFARHSGGEFLLRIEDTDSSRSTPAAAQNIIDTLEWLEISPDQPPWLQHTRLQNYQEIAEQWIANGLAYRCNCSSERLAVLRNTQRTRREKPRYDGHCRDRELPPGGADTVIRFRTPKDGVISFSDLVYGKITVANHELDDLILMRNDGSPTYHFSAVIDDVAMQITHVLRGDDHLNNTVRQLHLYRALRSTPPQFAHLPLILGKDKKRLSKRDGALGVLAYRVQGLMPIAIRNYLARLGWSHGDQEYFTNDELITKFALNRIQKSPATFDPKKLCKINQQHLQALGNDALKQQFMAWCRALGNDDSWKVALEDALLLHRTRAQTFAELYQQTAYLRHEEIMNYDEQAVKKYLSVIAIPVLQYLYDHCTQIPSWDAESIHRWIKATAELLNINMGAVGMPLRVALTGGATSPSINQVAALLGRSRCQARIGKALHRIQNSNLE